MTAPIGPYVGLPLKYRPRRFVNLIGQARVARILTGAFEADRPPTQVLVTGPPGVGKTTTARILVATFNCRSPSRKPAVPCGRCRLCKNIFAGTDIWGMELNAALWSSVDSMRELVRDVWLTTMDARPWRVCVLDEVQQLSGKAFDIFLKTLEEPPPHVAFVLVTTNPRAIPKTILSRCLHLKLQPVPTAELTRHLGVIARKEGASMNPDELRIIAENAGGQVRDALNMLQAALTYDGVKA